MMNKNCDILKGLCHHKDWGTLVLRVVTGLFFIAHGFGKFWGSPGFQGWSGMVTGMLHLPVFFAYLVAIVELGGGLLLVAGLWTRYATIPIMIVMLVAIFAVKISKGVMAAELEISHLAELVALLFLGSGAYGVDRLRCKKGKEGPELKKAA